MLLPLGVLCMALFICREIYRGCGAKPAALWAAVSVLIVSWWSVLPRIFDIDTPPALSIVGYMYLPFTGYSFLFLAAAGLADLILSRLGFARKSAGRGSGSEKRRLKAVFALVVLLLCYGCFEAKNVRAEEITVPTGKLPAGTDSVRIVQISDLHIGKAFDDSLLDKAVQITNAASPDLIVLTGDIIDRGMSGEDYYARALGSLNAPLGKFFITGNHEFYAGSSMAAGFMRDAGYTVLRSEWRDLGPVVIAGMDDPGRGVVDRESGTRRFLASLPDALREKFILFLKHQPHVGEDSVGLFDLQLSGHTHGGQIWPLGYLMGYLHGVRQGLSIILDNSGSRASSLYVSNGTGYWGPPVRVFAPPEVTIINVVRR